MPPKYRWTGHDRKLKPCHDLAIAADTMAYQAVKDGDAKLLQQYIEGGGNLNVRMPWLPSPEWYPHDVDKHDEWGKGGAPGRGTVAVRPTLAEVTDSSNLRVTKQP